VIGILGGSLFPEPWQGVALAVGLTFAIAAGPAVVRRFRTAPPEGVGDPALPGAAPAGAARQAGPPGPVARQAAPLEPVARTDPPEPVET
jgi:hypothetical protein